MKKIKRYCELGKLTLEKGWILFREYKNRKFHPQYLQELLAGKEILFHPYMVVSRELGEKNEHKTIAYLSLDKDWIPTAGFFALLHKTMCGLYIADKMGFVPVAANWDECAYEEEDEINGTNIVFEYYFQPVSSISAADALDSKSVVVPSEANMNAVMFQYESEWFCVTESYIKEMGEIYRKYIRLNHTVNAQVQQDMQAVLGGRKTLAVHFRGSDYRINANGHPMSLEIEDYYPYIDHAMKKYAFEQIFIATDDAAALAEIKNRYKNTVCYADVVRTEGEVSVAFLKNGRKGHKYRLGYEVLRDAYTMASCDGFIGGHSQVGVGVRFIKAGSGQEFAYCRVIEKGINRNDKDWIRIFHETVRGT